MTAFERRVKKLREEYLKKVEAKEQKVTESSDEVTEEPEKVTESEEKEPAKKRNTRKKE